MHLSLCNGGMHCNIEKVNWRMIKTPPRFNCNSGHVAIPYKQHKQMQNNVQVI